MDGSFHGDHLAAALDGEKPGAESNHARATEQGPPAGALIHRSCGELCVQSRDAGAIFGKSLHICAIEQKMTSHFHPYKTTGYRLNVL
jgi:hypothetical protein